jgi:hypothetical protein
LGKGANENMQEQYVAPELKLVGETNEVVLGAMRIGGDLYSELMSDDMEFETDGSPVIGTR